MGHWFLIILIVPKKHIKNQLSSDSQDDEIILLNLGAGCGWRFFI